MSKKPFYTVKGMVDFFKGLWPDGNGVHLYQGHYIAVSNDYITAYSNDSPTVFACSREQFDTLADEVAVEPVQTECERLTEAAIHVVGKQTGVVSNPMKWTVVALLNAGMLKMPDDTP